MVDTPIRQAIEHRDYNAADSVPTAGRPSKNKIARINKLGLWTVGWVSATLRQDTSRIRKDVDASPTAATYPQTGDSDLRFKAIRLPTEQLIVTSTGREDSSLFERASADDAYRPFEGTGAISTWTLSLPKDFRQFDYRAISDVIIHLRYTARDGGEQMSKAAHQSLQSQLDAMESEGRKRSVQLVQPSTRFLRRVGPLRQWPSDGEPQLQDSEGSYPVSTTTIGEARGGLRGGVGSRTG
ncbi:Tc toxin subunit A-related protein [Bradyrhizobium cenepequi]